MKTVKEQTAFAAGFEYTLSFELGFIDFTDIYVYTGEDEDYLDNLIDYSIVSPYKARITIDPSFPAGQVFKYRRIAPKDQIVNYVDGAAQNPYNLDINQLQLLQIIEEMEDGLYANHAGEAGEAQEVPSATEEVEGIAEIATQTETNNFTDDSRIVTPKKLGAIIQSLPFAERATKTKAGIAEIATIAETQEGIDDERFVTPKTLERKFESKKASQSEVDTGTDDEKFVTSKTLEDGFLAKVPVAATFRAGISERATQTEVNEGTDIERHVTPETLKSNLDGRLNNVLQRKIGDIYAVEPTTPLVDANRLEYINNRISKAAGVDLWDTFPSYRAEPYVTSVTSGVTDKHPNEGANGTTDHIMLPYKSNEALYIVKEANEWNIYKFDPYNTAVANFTLLQSDITGVIGGSITEACIKDDILYITGKATAGIIIYKYNITTNTISDHIVVGMNELASIEDVVTLHNNTILDKLVCIVANYTGAGRFRVYTSIDAITWDHIITFEDRRIEAWDVRLRSLNKNGTNNFYNNKYYYRTNSSLPDTISENKIYISSFDMDKLQFVDEYEFDLKDNEHLETKVAEPQVLSNGQIFMPISYVGGAGVFTEVKFMVTDFTFDNIKYFNKSMAYNNASNFIQYIVSDNGSIIVYEKEIGSNDKSYSIGTNYNTTVVWNNYNTVNNPYTLYMTHLVKSDKSILLGVFTKVSGFTAINKRFNSFDVVLSPDEVLLPAAPSFDPLGRLEWRVHNKT